MVLGQLLTNALKISQALGYLRDSVHSLVLNIEMAHTSFEEWFDPARLRDDYVPSGFKGYKVTHRAVPGHEFGLKLDVEDKAALIAFLKSL